MRQSFTQYVHEYTDSTGKTRFGVGHWNQERGQFTRHLTAQERRANPTAFAVYSRTIEGMPAFTSRRAALACARRLFALSREEWEMEQLSREAGI